MIVHLETGGFFMIASQGQAAQIHNHDFAVSADPDRQPVGSAESTR